MFTPWNVLSSYIKQTRFVLKRLSKIAEKGLPRNEKVENELLCKGGEIRMWDSSRENE